MATTINTMSKDKKASLQSVADIIAGPSTLSYRDRVLLAADPLTLEELGRVTNATAGLPVWDRLCADATARRALRESGGGGMIMAGASAGSSLSASAASATSAAEQTCSRVVGDCGRLTRGSSGGGARSPSGYVLNNSSGGGGGGGGLAAAGQRLRAGAEGLEESLRTVRDLGAFAKVRYFFLSSCPLPPLVDNAARYLVWMCACALPSLSQECDPLQPHTTIPPHATPTATTRQRHPVDFWAAARPRARTTNQTLRALGLYEGERPRASGWQRARRPFLHSARLPLLGGGVAEPQLYDALVRVLPCQTTHSRPPFAPPFPQKNTRGRRRDGGAAPSPSGRR